ncbi:MAG: hypothetical protein AKCLJLPJ_02485 [Fimbriimonadales bacterium]|nr:hypothetical protein [Fimbriimonadales bacterium]
MELATIFIAAVLCGRAAVAPDFGEGLGTAAMV